MTLEITLVVSAVLIFAGSILRVRAYDRYTASLKRSSEMLEACRISAVEREAREAILYAQLRDRLAVIAQALGVGQ